MTKRIPYLSNAVSMVGQSLAQKSLGFLTTMALAQMLQPHGLGLFAITNTTASSFYGFARFGADAGVHVLTAETDIAKDAKLASEIISHALILFLAIASAGGVACYVLADRIASDWFGDPILRTFIQLAALLLIFQVLAQFAYTAFAGLHAFTAYARISVLTAPVLAGLTIIGAYTAGAIGATIGLVAGHALAMVSLLLGLRKACHERNIKLVPRLNLHRMRRILGLGLPFYMAGLVSISVDYLVLALLVRGHGIATMGDLRVIIAITSIMSFLPTAVAGPMISALTQRHRESSRHFWQLLVWNSKAAWLLSMLVITSLGVLWDEIIHVAFGDAYVTVATCGYLALLGSSLLILLGIVNATLLSTKHTTALFWLGAGTAAVFICIAMVAVPQYGLRGYLVAQLISQLAALLLVFIVMIIRHEQGLENFRWVIPAAIITAAVFVVVILSNNMSWKLTEQAFVAFAATALAVLASARWVFEHKTVNDISEQLQIWVGMKRADWT
jgi:O-antigen/teichoic acid export membrane protein